MVEIKALKNALADRDKEIGNLNILNKVARETSEKLRKLSEVKDKYKEEKVLSSMVALFEL